VRLGIRPHKTRLSSPAWKAHFDHGASASGRYLCNLTPDSMNPTSHSLADAAHRLLRLATHFGDSAFLIPLSLAAVGIMIWNGQRLTAWRFAIAVDLLVGATVALKVSFYAIGGDTTLNVLSPSGHAGFSVTVYGCLATVLAKQLRAAGAIMVFAAAAALLGTVLASRVYLGLHTPQEVALGSAVGLACAATFRFWNPGLADLRLRLPMSAVLALVVGTVSVWTIGRHFDAERHIEQVGILVGASLGTLSSEDLAHGGGGPKSISIRRLPQ